MKIAWENLTSGQKAEVIATWPNVQHDRYAYEFSTAGPIVRYPKQRRRPRPDKYNPRDVAILGGDPSL